jgi:DNA invertase Pin-like site-specific DNA recombinase
MREETVRVVGYIRVSTDEQADAGASLDAQRAAIETEVKRRNWNLVGIFEDAASGKKLDGREGLRQALEALGHRRADGLVVAKLDRLSRSLVDFAGLMERSHTEGWALVALDLGVDTTTPAGELVASVMASVAQWERRVIGQRTRDALAIRRAQGVRLGRPPTLPKAVRRRIKTERTNGSSFAAIADRLNAEEIPTAHGGARWYPATVRKIAASAAA